MLINQSINLINNNDNNDNNNNGKNNNNNFFNLQVTNSPSRLRFEANLSRKTSELFRAQSRLDELN